jgi:hypothetical protein
MLSSPVPAGSRMTFFTRPKKVIKERTNAALGISVAKIHRPFEPLLLLTSSTSPFAPPANSFGSHRVYRAVANTGAAGFLRKKDFRV